MPLYKKKEGLTSKYLYPNSKCDLLRRGKVEIEIEKELTKASHS
jgi:hypothetical protein